MAVTEETLSAMDELFLTAKDLTDKQARELVSAYARAWDLVERQLEEALQDLIKSAEDGKVTRAKAARNVRLRKALQVLTEEVERLSKESGVRITKDLRSAIERAGKAQAEIIRTQLPAEATVAPWSQVNEGAIKAIVNRSTKQIESRLRRLPREQAQAMKRELIRGIVTGTNSQDVARRIMKATQGRFEGGSARATRIARTEMLDAMRAGAGAVDRQNKDVLKGWRWLADLGPRTCQACIGMHGRFFELDHPGPEGHPNCRCARMPATKSWADLGFKGIKEPPDLMPSAEAWFKGISQTEQKRILGTNYDSWKQGSFPLSQWAAKQDNPGWRPSWMPAKAA